jgi:hypothetical protein
MEWLLIVCILVLPVLVWILARVAALAWFKTKREHTRRLLRELGDHKEGD